MDMDELVAAIRALLEQAESEDRPLTDEEAERMEELEREVGALRRTNEARARLDAYETPTNTPRPSSKRGARGEDAELRAWDRYVRGGDGSELRALGRVTDVGGGYLAPDTFRDKVVECVKSFGGFAEHAENINTSDGNGWMWPTLSDETGGVPHEGAIVAEHAAFTPGYDPVFGENTLNVYKYATTGAGNNPIRVSVELLQDSKVDLDALLSRLMGQRIARAEAKHFAYGTGTNQPLGILTGTANTTMSITAPTYAQLLTISAATLDPVYLDNARWVMGRAAWVSVMGMVDDVGRPLIQSTAQGIDGRPGFQLLGYPVTLDMTFPAGGVGTNFMVFGDIRESYVVRRVQGLAVVNDPYARKNNGEVEFVAWERAGGTIQNRCAYVLVGGVA